MSRPSSTLPCLVRTLSYFYADRLLIALLVALIALSTLFGLLQVWPLAILVDSVMTDDGGAGRLAVWLSATFLDSRPAQIAALAALTLLLRLGQEVLNAVRGLLSIRIANNGLLRVRCDLFRQLQALSLQYHRSQPQGDAIYRLSNDAVGCQNLLNVVVDLLVAGFTLAIMLGILLAQSLTLTLLALAVAPPLLLTNLWFGQVLRHRTLSAKENDSKFTSAIQRSMASIGLMQAFGREAMEFGRFRNSVSGSLDAWFRFHVQFSWYRLCVGLIFGIGGAAIFGCGAWMVHRDQFVLQRTDGMTMGDLMVFLAYLGMFYDPLCKLSGAGAGLQDGIAGAQRVFEVLDRNADIADAPDAIALPRQPRTLALANLSFAYGEGKRVLHDVDVTIRPGEMVAFVGSSGVGKSTLLNLLPRFYDPTDGVLQLDGFDARGIKLADLRRHIALVLQESVVLPTTVAENIAYGRPDASDAQIRAAAELAGAGEFIEELSEGYATEVAEGGQNLSGGQRQRLAIARALLTEAPIIVLDEPTSALDPHHERLIVETLRNLKGQRTIILVSHRLSTVVDCDQIFMMHGGRVCEKGTHAQLLARRGPYYDMARHQLQVEEPEIDEPEIVAPIRQAA